MLGKWFNTGGEIYIFDEPSHGIDVGSKQEIYKVMVDLLKEDKAILMVSSDMPEVISMSDRVIVFKQGEIAGELAGEDITEENILTLSIGDQTRVSEPEISNTTLQVKESLFKRYENLTVLSIFASFVVIVVVVQLITTGGSRFPTFISPVNIVNILQQVAVPGIVADQHDHGDDLRRHRSLGRHAGLAGVDHRRARHLPVGSRRGSVDPRSASPRRSSSRRSWGSSFPEPASSRSSSRSAE